MDDERYVLVAIKRNWVPEWLHSLLGRLGIAGKWPLRWIINRPLTEFEDRRING